MFLTPIDQSLPNINSLPHRFIPQRFFIPRPKPPKHVIPRTRTFVQLKHPPHIILQVLRILGMDRVRFSFRTRWVEQRGDEELCESIEGGDECRRGTVEEVTSLIHPGESIRGT